LSALLLGVAVYSAYFAPWGSRIPEDSDLFAPVSSTDNAKAPEGVEVVRHRFVSVAPQVLQSKLTALEAGAKAAQSNLDLPLFDDVALKMIVADRQSLSRPGKEPLLVFSGGIEGEEYAIATITIKDGALFADITLPGRKFRIVPVAPPLHRIDEIDPGAIQRPQFHR